MSEPSRTVIDLTEDGNSPTEFPSANANLGLPTGANRPPRYARDIIDVDEREDEAVSLRDDSPEIQFLTSRPRSRSLSTTRHVHAQRRPGRTPAPTSPARRPHVVATLRPPITERRHNNHHHHHVPHTIGAQLFDGRFGPLARISDDAMMAWEGMFEPPGNLDFDAVAFNYENPSRPQQQPRLPTYEPPSPPAPGFTRSPDEDDTLVCPNCDDELGVGESELKRQVWVVKACGHVGPTDTPLSVSQY